MKSGKFNFRVLQESRNNQSQICVVLLSQNLRFTYLFWWLSDLPTSVFKKSGNSIIDFTLVYLFRKCAHFESTISPSYEINNSLNQLNIKQFSFSSSIKREFSVFCTKYWTKIEWALCLIKKKVHRIQIFKWRKPSF